jgi:two-component sensor histidine kinase
MRSAPLAINDDFPLVVATMPANARQRRIALGGFVLMAVVVAITLPFGNVELARVDAFVPVIQTVMCVADLLTATFLFAQYAVQSQRALLALASGYVFSGLFALLQTFTIPGAYVPGVLIGDDLYSAGWLFVFWHIVFPLAVIAYALLKDAGKAAEQSGRSTGVTVGITIAWVVTATAGLTWVATGGRYLPNLYAGLLRQSTFGQDMAIFLALLTGAAVVLLLFVRKHTILDQWLIVALLAWMPNFVAVVLFPVVRYTMGWYLSRVYALIAGSAVLFVLLAETLFLYARLANALKHQELLIAELDHRVKNILERVAMAAKYTIRGSGSTQERLLAFDDRIQSMAGAHALLSQSRWQGVSLSDLVRGQLAPYTTSRNMTISGPGLALTAAETQAVAMVLHELVTNAVKYGALSTADGRISVSWERRSGEDGEPRLIMAWREIGGPPTTAPAHPGYGTQLIRGLIPHELGGVVELVFGTDGTRCDIEFPLTSA